jgi:ABC transporter substrate binding protein
VTRREFITLIGGAAVWPFAARAQQPAMPIVGFVDGRSAEASLRQAAAFRKGLNETGYVEGQNVMVEYHWLEGQYDRLPALMADFVRRRVAVIAALSNPTALAAKAATTTIPTVFLQLARHRDHVTAVAHRRADDGTDLARRAPPCRRHTGRVLRTDEPPVAGARDRGEIEAADIGDDIGRHGFDHGSHPLPFRTPAPHRAADRRRFHRDPADSICAPRDPATPDAARPR